MLSTSLLSAIALLGFGSGLAETPRLDRYGDPLPPGAVARLGSLRLLCEGDLTNVVFARDGRIVAAVRNWTQVWIAGRQVGTIPSQFWEVATGRAAPAPENTRFINEALDHQRNQRQEIALRLRTANPTLKEEELQVAVGSPDGVFTATVT